MLKIEKITAQSDREWVEKLNRTAKMPADSPKAYMRRFVTMLALYTDAKVRSDSPEHFVEDLKSAGLVWTIGDVYYLNM